MTTSFISWIDYSPAEQDRMQRAIALFERSTDTRDELGLGVIRDALADLLFPGTSTIQTRLRYFLVVPWVYRELEAQGVGQDRLRRRLRTREAELIELLRPSGDIGVIGSQAGKHVKRMPSNIYWNGLRRWGIFRKPWSQDEYHREWDNIRGHNRGVVAPDDSGIALDLQRPWADVPEPPANWREALSFELTREEAEFLRGRMETLGGSLLAYFASRERADVAAATPWDATDVDRLPPRLRDLATQVRGFSAAMRGAALVYNLDLCQRSELPAHQDNIAKHEEALERWAAETAPVAASWLPGGLWDLLARSEYRVPRERRDREFVDSWCALLRHDDPLKVCLSDAGKKLVANREKAVKPAKRSRYLSPEARARWSGSSGTAPMDFRWFRVRTLLDDLYAGLDRGGR